MREIESFLRQFPFLTQENRIPKTSLKPVPARISIIANALSVFLVNIYLTLLYGTQTHSSSFPIYLASIPTFLTCVAHHSALHLPLSPCALPRVIFSSIS